MYLANVTNAYAVDAFTLNSNISRIIAFRLLAKFWIDYEKITTERSERLTVVLYWSTQSLQNSQNVKKRKFY